MRTGATAHQAAPSHGDSKMSRRRSGAGGAGPIARRTVPRWLALKRTRHLVGRRRVVGERSCKYSLDETFFSQIDTEEKAYWLGFLAADCGVSKREVVLGLATQDEGHLVKLRDALKANLPIHRYLKRAQSGVYPGSRLNIASLRVMADLHKHGVRRRKSLNLRWPSLRVGLVRHFIRGYFDGDGCLSVMRSPGSHHMSGRLIIVGPRAFMSRLQTELVRRCTLRRTNLRVPRGGKVVILEYGGRLQVLKLLHYLYRDSHVWLDRKYAKAVSLLSAAGPQQPWREEILRIRLGAAFGFKLAIQAMKS